MVDEVFFSLFLDFFRREGRRLHTNIAPEPRRRCPRYFHRPSDTMFRRAERERVDIVRRVPEIQRCAGANPCASPPLRPVLGRGQRAIVFTGDHGIFWCGLRRAPVHNVPLRDPERFSPPTASDYPTRRRPSSALVPLVTVGLGSRLPFFATCGERRVRVVPRRTPRRDPRCWVLSARAGSLCRCASFGASSRIVCKASSPITRQHDQDKRR